MIITLKDNPNNRIETFFENSFHHINRSILQQDDLGINIVSSLKQKREENNNHIIKGVEI